MKLLISPEKGYNYFGGEYLHPPNSPPFQHFQFPYRTLGVKDVPVGGGVKRVITSPPQKKQIPPPPYKNFTPPPQIKKLGRAC